MVVDQCVLELVKRSHTVNTFLHLSDRVATNSIDWGNRSRPRKPYALVKVIIQIYEQRSVLIHHQIVGRVDGYLSLSDKIPAKISIGKSKIVRINSPVSIISDYRLNLGCVIY